jgi:hypothetical protein
MLLGFLRDSEPREMGEKRALIVLLFTRGKFGWLVISYNLDLVMIDS